MASSRTSKQPLIAATSFSGGRTSARRVKPRTSAKRMVTGRRSPSTVPMAFAATGWASPEPVTGFIGRRSLVPEHLVPKNLIPEDLVPQHLVPEHLIPQHLVPIDLVPEHLIPQHLVPQHLVPEHLIPEDLVSQHLVPVQLLFDLRQDRSQERRGGRNVLASNARGARIERSRDVQVARALGRSGGARHLA